MTVNPII